jgi:hypothetical protein
MGWSNSLNGELLDQAVAAKFDVLLTADANIQHQQDLTTRPIAIVILRGRDNRLQTHIPMMKKVLKRLLTIQPNQFVEIQ